MKFTNFLLISLFLLLITGCGSSDEIGKPLNTIVYACTQDVYTHICKVNVDGTDQIQISQIVPNADGPPLAHDNTNSRPVMNLTGQVAFVCNRADELEAAGQTIPIPMPGVCVVNIDGSDFARLVDSSLLNSLTIDEDGVVYYECADAQGRHSICRINFDGSDMRFLLHEGREGTGPVVNSDGTIAFTCVPEGRNFLRDFMEICSVNTDGSGFLELTDDQMINHTPVINNDGVILYPCDEELLSSYNFGLCKINQNGSGLSHLVENNEDVVVVSMNNSDNYVYSCTNPDDDSRSICARTLDSQIHTIFGPADSAATINDADVIAYRCAGDEICVINFDGSDQRQITRDAGALGVPVVR